MANTYTWTIQNLTVMQNPQTDSIVDARWLCSGTDGTSTATADADVAFNYSGESDFVPFADVTESTVLGWVYASQDSGYKAGVESGIAANLDSLTNPAEVPTDKPLPWIT